MAKTMIVLSRNDGCIYGIYSSWRLGYLAMLERFTKQELVLNVIEHEYDDDGFLWVDPMTGEMTKVYLEEVIVDEGVPVNKWDA